MHSSYRVPCTILFFLFSIAYLIIISNVITIAVVNGAWYRQLATRQYATTIMNYSARAPINDRSGKALALNVQHFSACVEPRSVQDPQSLIAFLESHFPEAAVRFKSHNQDAFMYIKRHLTDEQVTLIENCSSCDITLLPEQGRWYPLSCASLVLGTTDSDNNGIEGIEVAFNQALRGTPSIYLLEREARTSRYFTKVIKSFGTPGIPVSLTLDSTLQFLVSQELENTCVEFNAQLVNAIVINPINGEILAMAQHAHPESGIATVRNTTLCDAYEMGSVIKVCTALAALAEGVVTFDELIDCKNKKTAIIDGRTINTTIAGGVLPFWQVIAQSNNIGTAQVAKRLDTKLYDHLVRMGFGHKTGIELPGEATGFINPPDNWSKHSIISLSYGYEINNTLMQLARFFCTIATNGLLITPHILYEPTRSDSYVRVYEQEPVRQVNAILEKTTLEGTARRAAIKGYTVRCKTGTANLLEHGIYNPDKNLFTCAGIIQKDDYCRVIVVMVKEIGPKNKFASQVAAPLFERIAQKTLIKDAVIQ